MENMSLYREKCLVSYNRLAGGESTSKSYVYVLRKGIRVGQAICKKSAQNSHSETIYVGLSFPSVMNIKIDMEFAVIVHVYDILKNPLLPSTAACKWF